MPDQDHKKREDPIWLILAGGCVMAAMLIMNVIEYLYIPSALGPGLFVSAALAIAFGVAVWNSRAKNS